MRKFSRARVLLMAGLLAAVTGTTGAAASGSASGESAAPAADSAARSDCRGIGSSFTDKLLPGRCLTNGGYRLEMQYDGNLVLYHGGRACWSSGTDGIDGVWAEYSGDWALDSPSMTLRIAVRRTPALPGQVHRPPQDRQRQPQRQGRSVDRLRQVRELLRCAPTSSAASSPRP